MRTIDMQSIVCLFCLLAAGLSVAGLFVPSISATGANPDTEAVVQACVEPASRVAIDITVTNPNSSNTVLLAFGKDLNADGELSAEEIKYQIGWDAGAWVEYTANAVDSVPLEGGAPGNRLSKQFMNSDWNLMNLIVRGDVSGKVIVGKPPTIILLR